MPDWIKKLARDWVLNKSVSVLAEEIGRDPAAAVALKAYRAGAPFMDVIKAYVAATETKDDDAVVDQLMVKPFNEVLPLLGAAIAGIKIPDMDGDATDDLTVGEFLVRVADELLTEK